MNSAELIRRAARATETGQPNLAILYMHRARQRLAEEVNEQRRERAKLSFEQFLIVVRLDLLDAAAPFVRFLHATEQQTQNQFALAGPSKGAAQ